MTLAVLIWSI